jgi:uncharacterized membrane protein YdjX (TVP38/TMEM64 family)
VTISWRWIAAATAGAALVLAALAGPATDLIQRVEGWLPGHSLGAVLLYAPIYALVPLLLMPATPFAIGAGLIFGFWLGLLAVMLGSMLTATSGFLLARGLFRGRLEQRIRRRPAYAAVDRAIARDGWKTLGLLRLTWLHCGLINYAYGLSAMPYRRFIVVSAVALVPGNAISVYLGAAGAIGYELFVTGEWQRTTTEYVAIAAGAVAAVVVSIVMATRAKRAIEAMAADTASEADGVPPVSCTRVRRSA